MLSYNRYIPFSKWCQSSPQAEVPFNNRSCRRKELLFLSWCHHRSKAWSLYCFIFIYFILFCLAMYWCIYCINHNRFIYNYSYIILKCVVSNIRLNCCVTTGPVYLTVKNYFQTMFLLCSDTCINTSTASRLLRTKSDVNEQTCTVCFKR